jgi:hypothetical protein
MVDDARFKVRLLVKMSTQFFYLVLPANHYTSMEDSYDQFVVFRFLYSFYYFDPELMFNMKCLQLVSSTWVGIISTIRVSSIWYLKKYRENALRCSLASLRLICVKTNSTSPLRLQLLPCRWPINSATQHWLIFSTLMLVLSLLQLINILSLLPFD